MTQKIVLNVVGNLPEAVMQCSLNLAIVIALILATIALLVAASLAAATSIAAPYPSDLVLIFVAMGLVASALFLMSLIDNAIGDYKKCCDQTEGESLCSLSNINNYSTAIKVSLGVALSAFGYAAVMLVWPVVGKILEAIKGEVDIISGIVGCGIAIGILVAMIVGLVSYVSCRDREKRKSPLSQQKAGLVVGVAVATAVLVGIGTSLVVQPEQLDVEGFVVDSKMQGIANATIKLYNEQHEFMQQTSTNSSGWYAFRLTQPGFYTLGIVEPQGYTSDMKSATVNLKQFQQLRVDFNLKQRN